MQLNHIHIYTNVNIYLFSGQKKKTRKKTNTHHIKINQKEIDHKRDIGLIHGEKKCMYIPP